MSNNLNSVLATVIIGGQKVIFSHLMLNQEFNHHHTFRVLLYYKGLEKRWLDSPGKIFPLIGTDVVISFVHIESGVQNIFKGIVQKVSYVGKNGGENRILISGGSPTVKLDGNRTMDSFADKSLKDIVEEAAANSGSGVEVTANPVFSSPIDYVCQYEESCFEFLNRLSWIYGEWFYYDGQKTQFGKPGSIETVELVYDVHIKNMNLSAQALPSRNGMYDYLVHDTNEIAHSSTDDDVEVAGYAKIALSRSSSMYSSSGMVPVHAPISSIDDLKSLVKMEKARSVGEMFVISGKSNSCAVGIGKIIKVKLPRTMEVSVKDIDKFLVRKVVHVIDDRGNYYNYFDAFVSDVDSIPMEPVHSPLTGPQIATVTDNEDSKGRIKVQFQWQKSIGKKTNWLRVQTPDAGNSKIVGSRGFTYIPEKGDQVMVGFEYGDPNCPYVMGSMFPESLENSGNADNKNKSIVTRSGISILLDDEKGSITIKDQKGVDSTVSLDGEGNVTISSKESITLVCGESLINMNKEGEIGVNGKTLYVGGLDSIDLAAGPGVDGSGGPVSGVHITVDEIAAASNGNVKMAAEKEMGIYSKDNTTVLADKELITKGEKQISIN